MLDINAIKTVNFSGLWTNLR